MKKHLVHYLLILVLAAAPLQTVLAGLAALEHATACEMGGMAGAEHAGQDAMQMDHAQHDGSTDMTNMDSQCDCCSDCMSMCVSVSQVSFTAGSHTFKPLVKGSSGLFDYQLATSVQYPPTDIRPPIVLL